MKHRIAIVGMGKIALDQHAPVLGQSDRFELAATVSSRRIAHGDLPVFSTPAELYAARPDIGVVAICTPPGVRHAYVREALAAGRDVLMEKPPTPTLAELDDLAETAQRAGRVLFAAWHSRFNPAVPRLREILARDGLRSLRIDWREDVRKWHPGQDWVFEPGGFGVFDPAINALSILTAVMPCPVHVSHARLAFPANRQTPIEADIVFRAALPASPPISAGFSWHGGEDEVWEMVIETGAGEGLRLEQGGRRLRRGAETLVDATSGEYERLYDHFARLLRERRSDVDATPLRLVADAFMLASRETVAAFDW